MAFLILDDAGFKRELEFLGISKEETGRLQHEELRELQVIWRKYQGELSELQEEITDQLQEELKELQEEYMDFQDKLSKLQGRLRKPGRRSLNFKEKIQKQGNILISSTDKLKVSQEKLSEPVQRSMEFEQKIQKQGNNFRSSTDNLTWKENKNQDSQQKTETGKHGKAECEENIYEEEKHSFSTECSIQITKKDSPQKTETEKDRKPEGEKNMNEQGKQHFSTKLVIQITNTSFKGQTAANNPSKGPLTRFFERQLRDTQIANRLTVPVQRSMEFGEAIQKQGNNLSSSADKLKGSQRSIKELEQKNVELRQNNAVFTEEIKNLANKLNRSTDKLTVYQKKIQELEQRNKELEEKVEKQGNKYEHMNEAKVPKSSSIQKLIGPQRKIKEPEQRDVKKIREQDPTVLDRYEIGEGRRGICLVINNVNFLGEDERRGGEIDEKKIAILFSDELHFKVKIKRNLGGLEILKTAQEIAAKDHSKYGAFVFIIMSHGEKKDVIQGVDGRKAGVEDLMSEFTATNCPTLQNKPKLFFIQACRGPGSDPRMNRLAKADTIEGDSVAIMHSPDSTLANGVSPREADFLLAFATVPGYKAWRSKVEGSWFIQVLVDVIRMYHRHHHLLDMLTEVNKQVADIANEYPDVELSFQVPAPTHTLRAQVFI